MPFDIAPPPISFPHRQADGYFAQPWQQFFLRLQSVLATSALAPADGPFVTTEANADLTNETNLGALASGWLRSTVALGVATLTSLVVVYSNLEPTVSVTIPANHGAVVPDRFVVAAGQALIVEAGAVFQIT